MQCKALLLETKLLDASRPECSLYLETVSSHWSSLVQACKRVSALAINIQSPAVLNLSSKERLPLRADTNVFRLFKPRWWEEKPMKIGNCGGCAMTQSTHPS